MLEPIVLSMSAISAFKRCRRSFHYLYERELEAAEKKEVVQNGTDFHAIIEYAARLKMHKAGRGPAPSKDKVNTESPMLAVAQAYLKTCPLPDDILAVETPIYTLLLDEEETAVMISGKLRVLQVPRVYIRTTPDMIYLEDKRFHVCRDNKTFSRAVTFDNDLDFQGKIYTSVIRKHYQTSDAFFEYENVRQEAPGPKWAPEDCYHNERLVIAPHEADELWHETQDVVRDLIRAQYELRMYRQPLKGTSPFTCGSCFVKDLCKSEAQLGYFDDQYAEMNYKRRDEADHMPLDGIVGDPRVQWYLEQTDGKAPLTEAVHHVYGTTGANKVRDAEKQKEAVTA